MNKTVQEIIDLFETTIRKCESDIIDIRDSPDKYSDKEVFLLFKYYDECKTKLQEYDCLIPWLIDEFGFKVYDKIISKYTKLNRRTKRGTKFDALKYRLGIAWTQYTIEGVEYLVGVINSSEVLFIEKME